uniref:Uncharacterized protein n=1 Tax=Trichobilharzia regenti TaxID=157069 RepID=A0AA85IY45_TRIRE|nr:unnamed protein product [Trichobilharzia regenti]
MEFSISLLGFIIIFLTILLNEVNGQAVVFNLKKALCTRLGETWGCLLDALPKTLGGNDSPCIS